MWTLHDHDSPPCWRLDSRPAVLGFSTRRGGVSAPPFDTLNLGRSTPDRSESVETNRRRLLAAYALAPERLVTAGQVHGSRVVRVEAPGHVPECDGLVTTVPGLALAVTTADCMPILLEARGAVAVAHSGWRGTADGMPRAALAALCEAGAVTPREVRVHIGPCIRDCCYEVGPEVLARFPQVTHRAAGGSRYLDLPRAACLELVSAGVPADAILDTGACTACEPARYFSHRRDGTPSGRHWGLAALRA